MKRTGRKGLKAPKDREVLELAPQNAMPDLGFVLENGRMVALIVVKSPDWDQMVMLRNIASHKDWRQQMGLSTSWKMWAVYASDSFADQLKGKILPKAIWMRWAK